MILRRFLTFCITFGLASMVTAANLNISKQQLYEVELIVFSHITAAGLGSESWPADPSIPSLARVYNLQPEPVIDPALEPALKTPQITAIPPVYQILPSSYLTLQKAAAALTDKSNYPLLVHVAWLQPGLPVRNSRRLHIYGGQAYDSSGNPIANVSPLNVADSNVSLPPPSNVDHWQLNGFLRFSKPYLFQLDADLVLTIPEEILQQVSSSVADKLKTNQFVLKQTFRMKLGQVYYIDHPLYGILAKVTKFPPKKKVS